MVSSPLSVQNPREWGAPLPPTDYELLSLSWITKKCADDAKLRRVSSREGQEIIGQKGTRDCSGLLVPYYLPGAFGPHSYRIRRDNPDVVFDKTRKTRPERKYLGAPGSTNRLYFPRTVTPDQLASPSLPLVVVEGEKKALAIQRLGTHQTQTPRFVAIAIPGVWNWRGVVGKTGGPKGERLDVKGPINDLDLITWAERTVYIIFDANVSSNESVNSARNGLARELASRHAVVRFVNLPPDCGVNGIDDLLAAWGPERVLGLFEQAISAKRVQVVQSPQFEARSTGMFRTANGEHYIQTQLTNYQASILTSIRLDDGVETRLEFEFAAELFGRNYQFTVPAVKFSAMDWPIEHMGPTAITFPNQRDYARTAIQSLSLGVQERSIYIHTGWRKVESEWVFLHAGGAISRDGCVSGINVSLPSALGRYRLDTPACSEDLMAAVRASLLLAELGPSSVSFPLRAATCRSLFGESDFSIHLVGESGAFKSELAALEQQFFGAGMNRLNLPGSWSSTGNSLEAVCFHAKDVLVVVDDFAPQGNAADLARYHAAADRVFRAAGNHAGRGRMDSTTRLREAKPPRGLILSTGEDVPRGHSVRARLLILELSKGAIDSKKLSECQKAAASGVYAQATAGFVQWLAGHYADAQKKFSETRASHRNRAWRNTFHARTPEMVANLQAAFEIYLEFAEYCGAVDQDTRTQLADRCLSSLLEAADAQGRHQGASEPTERFVSLLKSCLSSGRAHFASCSGGVPEESPVDCGWRQDGGGNFFARGECAGWIKGSDIYIDPSSAYRVTHAAGRDSGDGLALSEQTLRKRLHEKNLLASVDEKRETLTIRRKIGSSSQNVLHVRRTTIFPDLAEGEHSDVG